MDPHRLAIRVEHADGRVTRWGADDPDARNVPEGLVLATKVPGGFDTASCSLRRRQDDDPIDLDLFDVVKLYGPGGEVAWQGRQAEFPLHEGEDFGVAPNMVGMNAYLTDDPTFREIYVDRDLNAWRGISAAERARLLITSQAPFDGEVVPDAYTGLPALETGFDGEWSAAATPNSQAWYDAQMPIAAIYYAWSKGSTVNAADATWTWKVFILDRDTFSGAAFDATAELRAAGPGSGTLLATSDKRYGFLNHAYPGGTGAAGVHYPISWTCIGVYGTHGLTKQGVASATSAQGFYASDVIANIVARAAPKLSINYIEPTSFVIPHLLFRDPVTAEQAILTVNGFHLFDWGVDERGFFWRSATNYRRRWIVRVDEGATLDLAGKTGEDAVNGIVVTYTDPAGLTRTVGPPGSGMDYTDATLYDSSSTNPATSHGLKKYATLSIGYVTTTAGAIQIGARWLAEALQTPQRGNVTAKGFIRDAETGAYVPAWQMRAGDSVRVEDKDNVERRIVSTTYTHDSFSIAASLDNLPHETEAIMEQIQAELAAANLG